jgi:hypothetical protein
VNILFKNKVLYLNVEGRDHLGDPGIDGKVVLR